MATQSQKDKQRLRAERAAAALRERQRAERRRQLLTVAAVVVAIVVVVGAGFLINSMRDTSEDVADAAASTGSEHSLTIGPDSAPHKVVVYEDFLCPICGAFETAGNEQLTALAEAGKVQVEFRPFVLLGRFGPYSEESTGVFGVVLEQEGAEVAKDFHDLLFANQPSEGGPFPSQDELVVLAGQAGADTDAVQKALDDGQGKDWAEQATRAAEEVGVQSTPTVILDGRPFTDYRTPEELAANLVQAVQ